MLQPELQANHGGSGMGRQDRHLGLCVPRSYFGIPTLYNEKDVFSGG